MSDLRLAVPVALAIGLACVATSVSVTAQTAAAPGRASSPDDVARSRELFEEGRARADKGDWRGACPLFQAAHDLNRTNGTALSLADCYERIGQPERALPHYRSIVAAGDPKHPARVALATRRVAEIEAAQASPPAPGPPGATPATPAPVAPGASPPASASQPAVSRPPDGDEAPSRAPAYVAFGAGAAGLVVSVVFGAMAFSSAAGAEDTCPGGTCANTDEQQRGAADQEDARRNGWISVAGGGVAVVGVVAGIVLLATQPSGSTTSAGARGLTVRF